MKKTFFLALLLFAAHTLAGQHIVKLWEPGQAPGESGLTETVREDDTYAGVTCPLLEVYLPEIAVPGAAAVIICPGGSYEMLAFNHEGRDVARWLAERGIAGIVLKYRMPGGNDFIPGADLRQAIEIVREKAADWNLDPGKVGVMGFSAGGHLASTALTHFLTDERPDFGILVYPVISMRDELTHAPSRKNLTGAHSYRPYLDEFSNETRVSGDTPPVLILYSHDDNVVDVRNGTVFYEACVESGVPAELHIWPSGGHGWGWNEGYRYSKEMKSIVARWLSER